MGWFGTKTDEEVKADKKAQEEAFKRTIERAKASGLLKKEYKESTEQDRPGRPHFDEPSKK